MPDRNKNNRRPLAPHIGDPRRLEALRRSGLLDGETHSLDIEKVCKQAAELVGAKAAFLNVVTDTVQITVASWSEDLPSMVGLVAPLKDSFCHYVIGEQVPVIIPNSRKDARVCESSFTMNGQIVAYLGVPIIDRDGYILGSLCVTNDHERKWSSTDLYMLQGFASLISETL